MKTINEGRKEKERSKKKKEERNTKLVGMTGDIWLANG